MGTSIKHIFEFSSPFISEKAKKHLKVHSVNEKTLKQWIKKQPEDIQKFIKNTDFKGKPKQTLLLRDIAGNIKDVLAGMDSPVGIYEFAYTAEYIRKNIPATALKNYSFEIECEGLDERDVENAHLGWLLSGYTFSTYKKDNVTTPTLLPAKNIDKKRVTNLAKAIFILRNMVNTPARDLGPKELEGCAAHIAATFNADIKIIKDKELIKQNFPLIYTVGEGAADDRRPRLIDIRWGKESDPAVTLVGKGVCFDTGGLNLKPTNYMATMKKDMGGAAHALGVAYMIMAQKLPVRLRVLVPAVENSVSGPAFRPGDVIPSRKGKFVENTNTDAEGRLILADSLTYACEENTELVIDFATLTGSARAALGPDIPAMFSNNEKRGKSLQDISFKAQDPLWQMPLWHSYKKHLDSGCGDLINSASIPGDLIYSALFLENFLPDKKAETPDWIHIDCFAWELSGHAGRPKGAADTGLRAVYAYLEETYGK